MKEIKLFLFLMALAASAWAQAPAHPAPLPGATPTADFPEFSADVAMLEKGVVKARGKFFMGKLGTRVEIAMGGMSQVQIMRADKDVAWSILKEQGMYLEMPMQFNAMINKKWDNTKEECNPGEGIDGHPTKKCRVTMMVEGKKLSSTLWKAADLKDVVLKTLSDDHGMGMELKNIKPGSQPETLFAEPTGLKKIPMEAGAADMMKAMSGE